MFLDIVAGGSTQKLGHRGALTTETSFVPE